MSRRPRNLAAQYRRSSQQCLAGAVELTVGREEHVNRDELQTACDVGHTAALWAIAAELAEMNDRALQERHS